MTQLKVTDVKPFIGSRNFEESRGFYVALGWQGNWELENLVELELEGFCFYLQRYYQKQWCENSMLHITVTNADAWYQHVKTILETRS